MKNCLRGAGRLGGGVGTWWLLGQLLEAGPWAGDAAYMPARSPACPPARLAFPFPTLRFPPVLPFGAPNFNKTLLLRPLILCNRGRKELVTSRRSLDWVSAICCFCCWILLLASCLSFYAWLFWNVGISEFLGIM